MRLHRRNDRINSADAEECVSMVSTAGAQSMRYQSAPNRKTRDTVITAVVVAAAVVAAAAAAAAAVAAAAIAPTVS